MTPADAPLEDPELQRLADRLERIGQVERQRLQETGRVEDAPGEQDVAGFVQQRFVEARKQHSKQARLRSLRWAALAAAAILVAVLLRSEWFDRGVDDLGFGPNGGQQTLGAKVELLHPLGVVSDYGTFQWSGTLPAGGWYQLKLYAGQDDVAWLVSPSLRGAEWLPQLEESQSWPAKLRWNLQRFDASGAPIDSTFGEASLSP
jgi:hypothetical protein